MDEPNHGENAPNEADIVSQLQTCFDQLALQFYASLRYVTGNHPLNPESIPTISSLGENVPMPNNHTGGETPAGANNNGVSTPVANVPQDAQGAPVDRPVSPSHTPAPYHEFAANVQELARDLRLKQEQIEGLIGRLPDLKAGIQEEDKRIQDLAVKMEDVESKREGNDKARDELIDRMNAAISDLGQDLAQSDD